MKRKSFVLLCVSMVSAMVVGCVKPGVDPIPPIIEDVNYAEKVAGTFKGAAIYGSTTTEITTKALVKAMGNNVVEITVLDYQLSEIVKGDVVISDVKIALVDEKNLSLSSNGKATVDGKPVDVALTGSALVGGENIKFDASVTGYNKIKYTGSRYTDATGADLMSPIVSGICVISSKFDAAKGVLTYTVPTYTLQSDLDILEATFTISDGASWVVKKGAEGITKASEAQKLTLKDAETTIEVTAENGDKKIYTFKRELVDVEDVAVSITDIYEGSLLVIVGDAPAETTQKQNVTIVRTGVNTVKLTVSNLSFSGINLGDIVVNNVVLYKGQDEIALSGLGKVNVMLGDVNMEVDATLKGVYSISKKSITLKIDIAVNADLNVKVEYTGTVAVNPIATQPLFVSVSHSKILKQEFKNGDLVYYVDGKYPKEDFKDLKFEIKVPEGASYKVTSTPDFDFTNKTEWYTVTAADGKTTKNYSIKREGLGFVNQTTYDFTAWTETPLDAPAVSFSDPDGWQTPNLAVHMIKAMTEGIMYPLDGALPVNPIAGGKAGKAASIVTLDTKGGPMWEGGPSAPKITSGTIFTGLFNFGAAMGPEPLLATEFGLLYNGAKPTKLKGWYTYAPGSTYYDVITPVNIVDEPAISIILYDVTDDVNATIDGLNTYTSSRIVALGKINPAKSVDFKEFTADMVYTKEYTPDTRIYKLAIIMSASKNGHLFKGAPESKLVIDEVTIVTE